MARLTDLFATAVQTLTVPPATLNPLSTAGTDLGVQAVIQGESFNTLLSQAVDSQTAATQPSTNQLALPRTPDAPDAVALVNGVPANAAAGTPGAADVAVADSGLSLDTATAETVLGSNGLLAAAGLVVPPVPGFEVAGAVPVAESTARTPADRAVDPAVQAQVQQAATPVGTPTAETSRAEDLRFRLPPLPRPTTNAVRTPNEDTPSPTDPQPAADTPNAQRPAVPGAVTPTNVTVAVTNPATAGPPAGRPATIVAQPPAVVPFGPPPVEVVPPAQPVEVQAATRPAPVFTSANTTAGGRPPIAEDQLAAMADTAAARPTAVAPPAADAPPPEFAPLVSADTPTTQPTTTTTAPAANVVPTATPTVTPDAVRPPVAAVPAPTTTTAPADPRPASPQPVAAPTQPTSIPAAGTAFEIALASVRQQPVIERRDEPDAAPKVEVTNTAAAPLVAALPPTDTPTELRPAAAPVSVQLADGVQAHAKLVEREGTAEFRMRLDPPHLGRVEVHLVASADGVRGEVRVSDDAARSLVESQLPELRTRLEAAGVRVDRFDVTADAGGRGQYADRRPDEAAEPPTAPIRTPRPRAATPAAGGGLDVTA